jgi:hypothetical protein
MAIHNEAIAQQHTPHPEPIYYCATGEEMPLYEPCKDGPWPPSGNASGR